MTEIKIPPDTNFSFRSTLYSHGWADLDPFNLSAEKMRVAYTLKLSNGNVCRLSIQGSDDNGISVDVDTKISAAETTEISGTVKHIFRLDEDYGEFYAMVKKVKSFSWVLTHGAGRLLRAATLWEDMVKMLCTTNCTWRLTQIMTSNLVDRLGSPAVSSGGEGNGKAFPDADQIAACDESFLRQEIKMGYRAPYLLEFARSVSAGQLDLDELNQANIPTKELYKRLKAVKGIGDYAASNLLKLLGHYDYLGADSSSRQKFAEIHENGAVPDDKRIEAFYEKYGKWSGLFFWLDVTKTWYDVDRPW